MKALAMAAMIVSASALAASAQTTGPAAQPKAEPVPTPSSAMGAAGKTPKATRPKARHQAVVRPRGEPIVKGNTDVFVDSYGQLSTTVQP